MKPEYFELKTIGGICGNCHNKSATSNYCPIVDKVTKPIGWCIAHSNTKGSRIGRGEGKFEIDYTKLKD